MSLQTATEEYLQALRQGEKEYHDRLTAGKEPGPAVLDDLLPDISSMTTQNLGLLEIPADRIIGIKSAARADAFTASFLPLLPHNSEFGQKWTLLCDAHLSDTGIRDPIECYEYLGDFYVTEGNKRVSVLRYFGAAKIHANVKRLVPPYSEEPRIQAYYEFMEFFKDTRLYALQFRRPKEYEKLLSYLGKKPGEVWSEEEVRAFQSRLCLFRKALEEAKSKKPEIRTEDALLLWLQLYPFEDLNKLSSEDLKKSVAALWNDVVSVQEETVQLETTVEEGTKPSLITRIISSVPEHLNVALIQQLSSANSGWAKGHERGMQELAQALGEAVTIRYYNNINTREELEACLDTAVEEGAQAVFTTVPKMGKATLKAALKYPKVFFFNCSVDQPYSSIRTYYGRVYEGKFITGAIAGAMAQDDRIGYIASYPIYGVPASINAFALGAQMTNPRAKIHLRWSCTKGNPQADFFSQGIRVISNRDVPVQSKIYLDFCNYGTYLMEGQGELMPLASPVWAWGKFYEKAVRGILSGKLKNDKTTLARNYWLGMDSGVIDIDLSDRLPEGVRRLALLLKQAISDHTLDVFARKIMDQEGNIRNTGEAGFPMDELIHMDWLCEGVVGSIPAFDDLLPFSRDMVRELGIYRERIPVTEEKRDNENSDCIG